MFIRLNPELSTNQKSMLLRLSLSQISKPQSGKVQNLKNQPQGMVCFDLNVIQDVLNVIHKFKSKIHHI